MEPLEDRRLPANVLSFGAVGDGVHNDQPAFLAALDSLANQGGGTLTVPAGTYKIVQTATSPMLQVPANVNVVGAGATATELDLYSDVSTPDYRSLFMVTGSNTTLSGMAMVRKSGIEGVMVTIAPVSNFAMQGVTIDGEDSVLGTGFHATELLPSSAPASAITFSDDTITGVDYGFFIPNESTGSVTGFSVTNCRFHDNYADDLEFNAPNATFTGVTVSGNTFADNHSPVFWAGFGVGFAHVTGGSILNNTFTNYRYEPIHLEDRTSDVTVDGNTFVDGYTEQTDWSSDVFIITGSHDVSITNNVFDLTQNSNQVSGIYIGPGGVDAAYPYNVTVSGNTMKLNATGTAVTNYSLSGYAESNNLVEAPPLDLTATANAPRGVQLSWASGASDDGGYAVLRQAAGATRWSQLAVLPAGTTTFDDAGLTPGASYCYRVVATYGDSNSNSLPAQSAPIAIALATPSVNWTRPADITYGTPLTAIELDATASVPGTFTYSPPPGTILHAGRGQVLTVTFIPDDATHYVMRTRTITINVARATPLITWANPSDITYGTALGPIQLDATASVAGTFTYNPPPGTVLHAGKARPLTASFAPADAIDYNPVVARSSINVLRAPLTVIAPNQTRFFNTPNPPLNVVYRGFVNGDGPSNLKTQPVLSTTATTVSRPGTYAIRVSGASSSDYTISYVPGKLTVMQPKVLIHGNVASRGVHLR